MVLIFCYFLGVFSQGIVHTSIFGNTQDLGYYFVDIWVGTPPVKQTVILTTGASTTAFPCIDCTDCGQHMDSYFNYLASSTSKILKCSQNVGLCGYCGSDDLCRYSTAYSEGSSITGFLIEDSVIFGDDLNHTHNVSMVFGCHRRETFLIRSQLADGLLGLGSHRSLKTIVDFMLEEHDIENDVFTICMAHEGGFMTIGGFNSTHHLDDIKWLKMKSLPFYSISPHGLKIDEIDTGLHKEDFENHNTDIDSGTTFSYLKNSIFENFFHKFDQFCDLPGKCLGQIKRVSGEPHYCYEYDNMNIENSEIFFQSFPKIKFLFDEQELVWSPKSYLFSWADSPNVYCVGIYRDAYHSTLGTTFMRGNDVIFDRKSKLLGIATSDCGGSWNNIMGAQRLLTGSGKQFSIKRNIFKYHEVSDNEISFWFRMIDYIYLSILCAIVVLMYLTRKSLEKLMKHCCQYRKKLLNFTN